MPAPLVISGLVKRFGGLIAVQGVSLTIESGEIYGLLGPNGSGKSVLLKAAAGLVRPDAGTIVVAGVDILKSQSAAKRHIGYVPNDPTGFDRLTGRELLEFAGRLHEMPLEDRDRRIGELIERFDLAAVADWQFGECSRDIRQRLAMAAALLPRPALLLADEPFAWLDPKAARDAREVLREFAASGGAVIIATHKLLSAEKFCSRLGIMNAGRLVASGTVTELSAMAGSPGADLEASYLRLVR